MRLLTFNTLFKGDVRVRLSALSERLECYDVVCLQEVMWRRNARLLARTFPHFSWFGGAVLRGGLVLLSRRPIARSRFVRYPVTAPLRPELLMRKGVQIAVIDGLTVVNTHLSAYSSRIQAVELSFLADVLSAVDLGEPLVVVGDLNVSRTKLSSFIEKSRLVDSLAGDSRPTYRPTPEFPTPPAFDHILTRGPLTATASLVFQAPVPLPTGREIFLSDHYGVEAEIV
ncbi:hypothetical protein ACTI_33600 [Actinoplanes sp. OR16]|uniref:endonuclease/exonuclease/phosphatase family protein n=1 Tax=Actinoplanes sp. OR16 TaxID=946334 RepID=UPI000F70257D|nr:endonuclease/exonuclease/phosphatase family protein [Actinoplanes sp. OR16]BBH66675.1 hypothetical protein ACTI_33600 [Actinoplanes sp. OR16]